MASTHLDSGLINCQVCFVPRDSGTLYVDGAGDAWRPRPHPG